MAFALETSFSDNRFPLPPAHQRSKRYIFGLFKGYCRQEVSAWEKAKLMPETFQSNPFEMPDAEVLTPEP